MYRPADRPSVELAQRLTHKSGYLAAGAAVVIWGGGGAAAIQSDQPVAGGGQLARPDIHLMNAGTATAIVAQPHHRQQYGAAGSGVLLDLDPVNAVSGGSLELTVGRSA